MVVKFLSYLRGMGVDWECLSDLEEILSSLFEACTFLWLCAGARSVALIVGVAVIFIPRVREAHNVCSLCMVTVQGFASMLLYRLSYGARLRCKRVRGGPFLSSLRHVLPGHFLRRVAFRSPFR